MSTFGGLILTNRGKNLQSKAQAGIPLNYTRIGLGDGFLGSTSILSLKSLVNEIISANISKFKILGDGKVVVGTMLSNQDLTEGFYFREIGLFANDPDLGEVLYCYGNAGDLAEYIAPGGGSDILEKSIDIQTIIGNAQNVSAIIEQSLVYATLEDLNNIIIPVKSVNGKTGDIIGLAELDSSGKVLASQLPSYVDDVLEYTTLTSFPGTGESGKIYVAIDTNKTYRWSGSAYVEISSSIALGETSSTAYRGDRGKIAYDHSQVVHDKSMVGLSNVDNLKQMPISNGTLQNYTEKLVTLSGTNATINLANGNVFAHTLSGTTTYTISGATTGVAQSFSLIIKQGTTAYAITFPSSVKWADGEIPDLTTVSKTYELVFTTTDGGITWRGRSGGVF